MQLTKAQIRKDLRKKRHSILPDQREKAGLAAEKIMTAHAYFQQSQQIGCYLAREDEFDCTPLISSIWEAQKKCYLPSLSSEQEKFLKFVPYGPHDSLQPNRYQILEPKNKETISAEELDLVFVPLLGFDLQGHRLGMGGGYYDRSFAFLLKKLRKKPYLIGLGYEDQLVEELPHDDWDVPLDGIVTETRFIKINSDLKSN